MEAWARSIGAVNCARSGIGCGLSHHNLLPPMSNVFGAVEWLRFLQIEGLSRLIQSFAGRPHASR